MFFNLKLIAFFIIDGIKAGGIFSLTFGFGFEIGQVFISSFSIGLIV